MSLKPYKRKRLADKLEELEVLKPAAEKPKAKVEDKQRKKRK